VAVTVFFYRAKAATEAKFFKEIFPLCTSHPSRETLHAFAANQFGEMTWNAFDFTSTSKPV
jgi:hypothetical protein